VRFVNVHCLAGFRSIRPLIPIPSRPGFRDNFAHRSDFKSARARRRLEGKLKTRRSSSRLPALVEFVMARPIASAGMIAAELGVTPRAAQTMAAELGLREMTGRGRYRAWGIL